VSFGNSITSAQCRNTLHTLCTDKRCACRCHNPDQGDLFEDMSRESGQAKVDLPKNPHDTQIKAAASVRAGTGKARVLEALQERPMTDEEIARHTGLSINTARPRRVDLVEGGLVHDTGERRKTDTGHDAIVWGAE